MRRKLGDRSSVHATWPRHMRGGGSIETCAKGRVLRKAREGEGATTGPAGGGDWKMCSNNVACVCRGMVFKSSPPIPSLSPHATATAVADGHTTRARAVGGDTKE